MAAGAAPAAVVVGAPAAIVGAGAAAGAGVGVVASKRATSLVRFGGTSLKFDEAAIGRVQQYSGISNDNQTIPKHDICAGSLDNEKKTKKRNKTKRRMCDYGGNVEFESDEVN